MAAVWITAVFGPIIIIVATLIGDVVRTRFVKPNAPGQPAPVPVGQTIDPPVTDWARTAYARLELDLAAERADHAECHAVMREHDLPIPHD